MPSRPSIRELFKKGRHSEPDVTSDDVVISKVKNDLLDDSSDNEEREFKLTYQIIRKHGLSKATIKLTKKNNIAIRNILKLQDTEYLLLSIIVAKGNACPPYICRQILNIGISASDQLYNYYFKMYLKGWLMIQQEESAVVFGLSIPFRNWLNVHDFSKSFEYDETLPLKNVIAEIDKIANLYNNYSEIVEIAETYISKILEKYENTYEYCQAMLTFKHTDLCEFYYYILGHMILTGRTTISKHDELINLFVSWDGTAAKTRATQVNALFEFVDEVTGKGVVNNKVIKIFDRAIDESGKADKESIMIHTDFKRKYLKGVIREKVNEQVIKPETLEERELFFNEKNDKRISELTELLMPEQFTKIKERLKDNKSVTGFVCMFSGAPGGGKTASCYKIAKQTGRELIKINLAELRDKFWGEDEKNVKAIFDNYRSVLKESALEPILFLNEADALFGKRLDIGGINGALINSINAVQNIILDELENFEGILIATTNLTQNMDSAFERRILFKIDFEKPNDDTRLKIWKSMLTDLTDDDAKKLANKYEFSGGSIENIRRKHIAHTILYGQEYDINRLIEYCDEEKMAVTQSKPIGFGV